MDIPDSGGAPAMSATLMIKGFEGRGAGIKIRDSVNSASNSNNREWFIGSGYAQSGFNIGYASDGSQSSYAAQNKFSISTAGHASFAGNITATGNLSAPIYYDSDNTSRYFNGNGTSVFGHITTSNITATGTHKFVANDVDFIVQDTTDSITNYIWRHHGNSKLYLGSQAAVVDIRSPIQINSTQIFDISRNLSNVGSIASGGNIVNDIGNSGNDSFIELRNTGYTSNITSLRQNADSTRAELNSSERSIWVQAGLSSSNSAEFRVYNNAVLAQKIDASQNTNFYGSIILNKNDKVVEIANAAIQWYSYPDSAYKQAKFRATDYQFKNGGNTPIMTINNAGRIDAASLYDSDNTAYYVNPSSASMLNNLDMRGTGTKLPAHAYSNTHDGTNVYWHVGTAAGSTNKILNLRVYKSDNTNYTTHKFTTTGIEVAEALKIGTTTVIDSSRQIYANHTVKFNYNNFFFQAGTGTVALKNASGATKFLMGDGTNDINGTVDIESGVSGTGTLTIGKQVSHTGTADARITVSNGGSLYIDSKPGQHLHLGWWSSSAYDIISEMNARFASYKDRNDTAYYVNPAGASLIRNLEIKGTTSDSSTDALHIRNAAGATQSYFRNDGTVIIGGSQYLYVTAGGGAYFSNSIKARGGINNDQGDLLLNDTVQVAGPVVIQGNGSADRMLAFTLDGRASPFTGSNNAFIFNGQGSSGDYLAGALYFQSRSNSVNREIGFITGTTPAKRLVINNSGITVTGTITGDITGTVTGTATQAANLNNHTTNSLTEGSNNLYYTDTRVGNYLSNNGYATQSTIVAAITDSAPSTLDTLNELAAALGDDANFSTTVTNSIATKAPIANPSLTGNTSIAGNLMMTSSTSHIELGSYLKLYAATASNTGTIAINANYGGAQTDSWTADYSGDVNAGMWLLRQSSGGSGTMQVYQKKHGTSSGSHARSSFTKTAEFNVDGHFYGRNLRSERYYSSDNTSWYTDPSETSVINKLLVNGASNNSGKADFAVNVGGSHSQVSLNGNQVQAGSTDMNWNSKFAYDGNTKLGGWDNNVYIFTQAGSGATAKNIYFQPQAAGGSSTNRLTIHGDNGAVIADTQMRAPIFYDSDSTSYYTNPASNSVLSTLSIGTTSAPSGGYALRTGSIQMHGQGSLDYIGQLHFYDNVRFLDEGNSSYLRYRAGHSTTGGMKYYNGSDALQGYVYFDSAGFGLLSADGSWAVRTWNTGAHIYHSTRSPVYYDSDDTAYYVDPNHTTTSAKFAGNVEHKGLTMTSGTDVDQLYTVTVSATLSTTWQDTGINSNEMSTGTYIVQVSVNDQAVGGQHYNEMYSGVMSWYGSSTNSSEVDEIVLHRAGHAPNAGNFYLRTERQPSGNDNLMIQMRGTTSNTGNSNYVFKFRRMI